MPANHTCESSAPPSEQGRAAEALYSAEETEIAMPYDLVRFIAVEQSMQAA